MNQHLYDLLGPLPSPAFALLCELNAEEAEEYAIDWALRALGWVPSAEDDRGLGTRWEQAALA